VRINVAKSAHAVLPVCDTPPAQQALSPAKALNAISIAAATKAVVVILILDCSDRLSFEPVQSLLEMPTR